MTNDKCYVFVITAIENLGMMAFWTGLATFFDKWWIALFAILFFASGKSRLAALGDHDDSMQNM